MNLPRVIGAVEAYAEVGDMLGDARLEIASNSDAEHRNCSKAVASTAVKQGGAISTSGI